MGNTLRECLSCSLIIYQCLPSLFVVQSVPDLRFISREDAGLPAKPRSKARTMHAHNKLFKKLFILI